MNNVSTLLKSLACDAWRESNPFNEDLAEAQRTMLEAADADTVIAALSAWLQRHQPCLFGRIAAKTEHLDYCVLLRKDLERSDEEIAELIRARRLAWKQRAFLGQSSGFIVIAIAPEIAHSEPNSTLLSLAKRLGELYLVRDLSMDEVMHEDVFLEVGRHVFQWRAGVNYFCANADGRWWHDHRIPGGLAFSVNSVGHMVKSNLHDKAMNEFHQLLEIDGHTGSPSAVSSLEKSLDLAMRTIDRASDASSGKATMLLEPNPADQQCPFEIATQLRSKSYRQYGGWYHTDYTLPSLYFREDVLRPTDAELHSLDFTYLFDKSALNPDFYSMGSGIQIRREDTAPNAPKRTKGTPRILPNEEAEALRTELKLPPAR